MTARAKAAGRFVWARYALVEHRHPLFLKAELDGTYLENGPRLEADRRLFAWRQEQGWPEAWESALEPSTPSTNGHEYTNAEVQRRSDV